MGNGREDEVRGGRGGETSTTVSSVDSTAAIGIGAGKRCDWGETERVREECLKCADMREARSPLPNSPSVGALATLSLMSGTKRRLLATCCCWGRSGSCCATKGSALEGLIGTDGNRTGCESGGG